MNGISLLAVAAGGALGAVLRYGIAQWTLSRHLDSFYPFDTLLATALANVVGSVLMGVAYVLIVEQWHSVSPWRELIMVGFLGALTTFSTFALETLNLMQQGFVALAVGYGVLSVVGCTLCVFLGMQLTRSFF